MKRPQQFTFNKPEDAEAFLRLLITSSKYDKKQLLQFTIGEGAYKTLIKDEPKEDNQNTLEGSDVFKIVGNGKQADSDGNNHNSNQEQCKQNIRDATTTATSTSSTSDNSTKDAPKEQTQTQKNMEMLKALIGFKIYFASSWKKYKQGKITASNLKHAVIKDLVYDKAADLIVLLIEYNNVEYHIDIYGDLKENMHFDHHRGKRKRSEQEEEDDDAEEEEQLNTFKNYLLLLSNGTTRNLGTILTHDVVHGREQAKKLNFLVPFSHSLPPHHQDIAVILGKAVIDVDNLVTVPVERPPSKKQKTQ
jgi:hypothetical protein